MTAILPSNTAFHSQLRLHQHQHPAGVAPATTTCRNASNTKTRTVSTTVAAEPTPNSDNNKAMLMSSSLKKVAASGVAPLIPKNNKDDHHEPQQQSHQQHRHVKFQEVEDDLFSLHNHRNALQRSLIVVPFSPPLLAIMPKPILKNVDNNNGTNDTVSTSCSTSAFDEDTAVAIAATANTTAKNTSRTTTTTTTSSARPTISTRKRHVQFDLVHVREYPIVMGDNPACTYGAPIMLDWGFFENGDEQHEHDDKKHDILYYETIKSHHTNPRHFLLNSYQRRDLLRRSGYSDEQIQLATRQTAKVQRQREWNKLLLPFFRIQEAYIVIVEKCCRRSRSSTSSSCRPRPRRCERKQQNKKGTRTAGR